MKVFKKIKLKFKNSKKYIFFGIPGNEELRDFFHFRYINYYERGYIKQNVDEIDVDEYDDERSVYFVAKIENKIIGCSRLIIDKHLPTEKDCFNFEEPDAVSKIEREKRAEVSRLIVSKYEKGVYLPKNLVMLGLFDVMVMYCRMRGIRGGYSFIKQSLKEKLDKLKFPYHPIKNYKQIYKKGVLENYFSSNENPVIPIYYLLDEIENYINRIYSNKLIFIKINDDEIYFKSGLIWKVYKKFFVKNK